ncbi:MAG: phosphoenolpyruvate synthase/pyruvate phosphate dikinase [Desulfobacteraceae bacterium]|nr:phosphoenolpyruvate synthase/pyruvate phosphate dikinase [Desulfobacteraceae bacterium]
MTIPSTFLAGDFETHFKVFHELMSNKVQEILLVASPYDAYILEEDGSLSSKIINEYQGLNLSRPPRITHVSSARDALEALKRQWFDLVITMPHLDDMDTFNLGLEIKKKWKGLPVILLAHNVEGLHPLPKDKDCSGIDQIYIWSGDADLLLAIVKNVEDRLNAPIDTRKAMVRVLLLVDDSPLYRSFFLPLIYKEVVNQTQDVIEETLNEEHRLLKMRARPKILVAENYEEAMAIYGKYKSFIFGVITDTRFPKNGKMTADAGLQLLSNIKREIFDLPLLLMSSESENNKKAERIPAQFIDKNSPHLYAQLDEFFLNFLGFGDFVFRNPDGTEVARASDLRALERLLPSIPPEPLCYHAGRNRFSNWIMARSEISFASKLRQVHVSDFPDVDSLRLFLINSIHSLRKWRQKGVVAQFNPKTFDPELSDFLKIGNGSLGGKARGLAFVSNLLRLSPELFDDFQDTDFLVPSTLVITTEGFDSFVKENKLQGMNKSNLSDKKISERFLQADLSPDLIVKLKAFLSHVNLPLSIRSSSLLEDAHYHPYSGLYKTYIIPNNHPDPDLRLSQLVTAVKLVFASTYFTTPRTFTSSMGYHLRKESMAVIIQQAVGKQHGDYFYPTLSGIAQSQNFYPVNHLSSEDGVVRMAMGFGKIFANGEPGLRFSPKFPKFLPQFSKVDDILVNAQRTFYALKLSDNPDNLYFHRGVNLEKRMVNDAVAESPVRFLCSTYVPEEHRIRDTAHVAGPRIVTFFPLLKHGRVKLAKMLKDLLEIGQKGMGCPVEFEFSMNLSDDPAEKNEFYILQMRPMSAGEEHFDVELSDPDIDKSFCFSEHSLGHGRRQIIQDIVYVRPDTFASEKTLAIAGELSKLNAEFSTSGRPYLLIGPGRWGSFDRWLGIPVKWEDISGIGGIVELRNKLIKADPSHGSHFFQKITALGIPYLTITEGESGFIKWDVLKGLPQITETTFLSHVRTDKPFIMKIDGRTSRCAIYPAD